MPEYDANFQAGGVGYNGDTSPFQSFSDTLGRIWNNLNGTTAANQANAIEAEKARVFSSAEAQKNRDWETYMSNTAYQRAVNDMKAAGLNPASIGGNAASTPSGQMPSAAAAHATAGGNGGFLGLIAKLAAGAIGGAIAAKFQNSAKMAGSAAGVIRNVSAQASSAQAAAKKSRIFPTYDRYGVIG